MSVVALVMAVPPANAAGLGGLWFFWQGSGQSVHDFSGNGLTATLGSTSSADANDPTWTPGAFYGLPALHFNGNDFLTVPDAPSLDSAAITVAAVVRAPTSPGPFRYVASKGAFQCLAGSYGLYTGQTGGLSFYVSNGTSDYTVSPDAGTGVWDGRWHLVVGTYNGSTVRLYVDGRQVGTGSASTITIGYGQQDSNQFAIGDYQGPCPTPMGFIGDMEGVAVLNSVTQWPGL
jgi:hypothetical protein